SELTVGEVAQRVSLPPAPVATIIHRLEQRAPVKRARASRDTRKVDVSLTDDAHAVLLNAPNPRQESFVQQFQDLHDWEQTMILSALERVAYMMDAQHIDASPVLDIGRLDRTDGNL